ncbi:DUF3109 family protein [Dyadobacter sediminis]|uniref:DUF3109 family protein n=1 Tax=Dyadobacter sediminis TaxID=1493691 RepID=A0A5R9KED9_9BACT|nr:DUF3109 family protein [Dyadobacter sediminis]TLU94401.1 DUF3109 family protein [Dyadobacter sediminis]GGB91578.1 hypothetical protein GCM10011325_18780 [Dyadobacter sediminis]
MILIENTCISDDVEDQFFVCNLDKCKGACCVEGDSGAPLDEVELAILDQIYPHVEPYLSEAGKEVIAKEGTYTTDWEGDYVTPVINGRECAYAIYDKRGILKCGIEEAYNDGKIDYKKPISCHLYPIRVTKYEQYHALNYDRWEICSPACGLGKELGVPVYKFLKEPLIRAYGTDWYDQLTQEIHERQEARGKEQQS